MSDSSQTPFSPVWEAPPAPPLGADGRHLWLIELDRMPGRPETLAADEAARAARLLGDGPRARFVAARGALRAILAGYCGAAPGDLRFVYGPHGKPSLAFPGVSWGFNLTHSGGVALLAVSGRGAVGVDLEPLRELPDALRIGRRMFAPAVLEGLAQAPPDQRSAAFLRAWTVLEACVKLRGGGVFQPELAESPPCHPLHLQPLPGWLACVALPEPHEAGEWRCFRYENSRSRPTG